MIDDQVSGGAKQSQASVEDNVTFFRDSFESYRTHVLTLDTYASIRASVNDAIAGVPQLIDIGNGGVFDYDVNLVPNILALDLFLDQIDVASRPAHITFVTGSALDLPILDGTFDGVLINMLLHHLVGQTVDESIDNLRMALSEALRVLKPGGRLVLIESCVPRWFYLFERLVFRVASRLIGLVTSHPITLQYPSTTVARQIEELGAAVEITRIPKGRWVLQYGIKVPSFVTPVCPYRFVAYKRL